MMDTRRFFKTMMVAGGFATIGIAGVGANYAQAAPSQAVKFSISESLRREKLTQREDTGFSTSTVTQSALAGELTIGAELPLGEFAISSLGASTPFAIKAGGFEFKSTLGSDPQYRVGNTSATLTQTVTSSSGNTRTTFMTARLKWTQEKLTVQLDATTPQGGKPIAAEDFLEGTPGKIEARTEVNVQLGNLTTKRDVPFSGRMKRKVVSGDGVAGEVVTIELRGEAKGPAKER